MKKSISFLFVLLAIATAYAGGNIWHRQNAGQITKNNAIEFRPNRIVNQTPIYSKGANNYENPSFVNDAGVEIYAYSQNFDDYTLNGLVKFNSNSPEELTRIKIIEDEATAGAFGGDAYYVMCTYQYFYPGGLYTVDLETGELTLVASYIQDYNVRLAVDMSYDYTTETMYMIYPSDNDSYLTAFGSVDLKTGQQTFINHEMDRYVRAIAVDKEGILYGIDEYGMLITIDKITGECTELYDLGIRPFYRQSMDFNRTTGELYWAFSDTYEYGTLNKVDVSNGTVTTIGKIGSDGDEKVIGLHIPYIQCDPAAPAKVDNLSIIANPNGELNASLSWTCPSKTADGNTLDNIEKVIIYRNGEVIATLTDVAPGKDMIYDDNVSSAATYTYKVVAANEKGEGIFANISTFIGHDLPAAVRISSVKRQGRNAISITWEPASKGINNGYLDTNSIKYKITRISDNQVMAENLTETTFTDNTITTLDRYRYAIEVSNADGVGGITTTGYIVNGPARDLPLVADFNDEEEAGLWSIGDANGDGVYFFWQYNSYEERGYYYYQTEWDYNANDWLISPITKFEAGKNYKAIVNARPANEMNIEKMEFYLVKDYNISDVIKIGETFDVVGELNELINDVELEKYRTDFNNVEGEYSFAIRCISNIDESYWLAIADVEVAENHDGHIRGDVWDNEGNPVEGVLVQVDGTDFFTYTDSRGQFEIKNILQGDYTVTCSKLGYKGETIDVTIVELETKTLELDIVKRNELKVNGIVTDEYGSPLANAEVNLTGYNSYTATTNGLGKFVIEGVYDSSEPYTLTVLKPFYEDYTTDVMVETEDVSLSIVCNDQILQPAHATATISDDNSIANIEWTQPAYETTIKKHSDNGGYTFGSEEGDETTLLGIVCRQPMIINSLTWCLFESYESINVVILALDENGNCTNEVLYKDDDAANNPFNVTICDLSENVIALNGCFIGLSCDEGYLSLLTTPATPEYPFVKNFNAYLEDYTSSTELNYVEALGKDYEENFYLNATGMLLADASAPNVSYNLYRIDADGQGININENPLTSLYYADNSWANVAKGSYRYAITALYKNGKESEQTLTAELDKTSSIENINESNISVKLINNLLILSEEVENVDIFSIDGRCIISNKNTSAISLRNIPLGIYIVNIKNNNTNYTKKISIK